MIQHIKFKIFNLTQLTNLKNEKKITIYEHVKTTRKMLRYFTWSSTYHLGTALSVLKICNNLFCFSNMNFTYI